MNDLFNLKSKTVLITGASSGLGKQFAYTLSKAGARVILSARRIDKLQKITENIKNAKAVQIDVDDQEFVNEALAKLEQEEEKIDISLEKQGLINSKRSKSCKLYKLCESTIKKFFQNQDRPTCPLKVATPIYKDTKNNKRISSYKKKEKEFLEEKTNKIEIIKQTESDITKKMIYQWNEVFLYSLKPIKAYSSKSVKKKLIHLYENKFNYDLDQWKSYV